MRAAVSYGRRALNAGALLGNACLAPHKVNEFVILAVTHPVDGHASGADLTFATHPAAGSQSECQIQSFT
jgi:hypothetical protein